ncbi:unnamed protein product [Boreogadus saida]
MNALIGLLLLVFGHDVSSVIHSLQFFHTASSGISTFPEFVMVVMVDKVQVEYYDSNTQRIIAKQDWVDQANREDPNSLERETEERKDSQQVYKGNIEIQKKLFNLTGGAHIVQRMNGCEWDDEDGTTEGYDQYGFDGEDFIALDLKTLTWVAPVHQAFATKLRLDHNTAFNQYKKNYYTKVCVDVLKQLLAYGKSTLQRTGDNHILVFILTGVAVVAAVAVVVGVFLYQKRNDSEKRHKPVGSDTSSENTEGQKPSPEAQPLTTVQS